jgi:hypothetical protein
MAVEVCDQVIVEESGPGPIELAAADCGDGDAGPVVPPSQLVSTRPSWNMLRRPLAGWLLGVGWIAQTPRSR